MAQPWCAMTMNLAKRDHRHLGKNERQQAYRFTTLEQLIMDFEADVIRLLGGKDESDH